jgi:hypothetical protein
MAAAVSQQEEEDAQGQQDQGWQGGAVVTPGGSGRDLVALLTGLSTEPSLSAASTASRSRRRRGMPPLGHVPRVKQLPVDSQFQVTEQRYLAVAERVTSGLDMYTVSAVADGTHCQGRRRGWRYVAWTPDKIKVSTLLTTVTV